MSSETSPTPDLPTKAKSKSSCLLVAAGVFLLVVILLIGGWLLMNRPIQPVVLSQEESQLVEAKLQEPEPGYERGSKEIVLTEREINGLLHRNTNLGDKLKLELVDGAIHARIDTDLDEDLPMLGGKRFKARARFLVESETGAPALVLDDLSLWGVSLPNDWLGGIKGQDLLGEILGGSSIGGVDSFRVERGRVVIRLKE